MISRRKFMKRGAQAGASIALGGYMARAYSQETTIGPMGATALSNTDRVLVIVRLDGGNDGLNTLVHYRNDDYYHKRPTLGIPENDAKVNKLDDDHGFHPTLTGFKQLQDEGRIDLDAKYFNDLLGYSDPLHTTVSYNPKFSPKMLSFLCFTSMSMFWGLSFVFRPKRAFVLFYQLLTRDNSSKLAYILSNKLRKKSAKKMAEQSGDQTVVINDMFKPVAQKQANAGRG